MTRLSGRAGEFQANMKEILPVQKPWISQISKIANTTFDREAR